jgi:nucleotide-binding universal stress UspA family protein
MKNIIVPVDFSEESLNGLKIALLFSRKITVNIQLVYVMQKVSEQKSPAVESDQDYAAKQLDAMVKKYRESLGNNSSLQYIIKKGRIYQEIVNQAQTDPDTLIAASTHGASGFQEFFIGSNAYRIISSTDKPVITIRKGNCPENFGKIVLPIDITHDTRQKVPFTTELAKVFGSEIHVLGIQTSNSERESRRVRTYVGQVAGYIQGKAGVVTNEVKGDNVADMVVNYARSIRADLIIGNTAHLILNKADVPVLSLSPRNIRISGSFNASGG